MDAARSSVTGDDVTGDDVTVDERNAAGTTPG